MTAELPPPTPAPTQRAFVFPQGWRRGGRLEEQPNALSSFAKFGKHNYYEKHCKSISPIILHTLQIIIYYALYYRNTLTDKVVLAAVT